MYTPQRLFGEGGSSSDILSHEPFLERARLHREQEREGSARLALGAYVVARLVDKLLMLENDREAFDGFRWQLEAVRRHVQELPGDAPETAHLAGIIAAVPSGGRPTTALWMNLTAYAYFLEHEARLEESLEMLNLAARSQGSETPPGDFAAYALFAGRLNRLLARWDVATSCYQAAEEAASSLGDVDRSLRARLGRAHVYRGYGNLPQARAQVEQVAAEAQSLNLADLQSDAQQDLGVILMLQGLRSESLEASYKAFWLCQEPLNRMRILGDLGYGLSECGHFDAARVALEIVVTSNASQLIRLNALLELMQLESAVGHRVPFERRRHEAKELVGRMTPSMAVDFRYKTAVGLARFGQLARARESLKEAMGLAEQHQLNEWYFRLERTLDGLATETNLGPDAQAPTEVGPTPAVCQMEAGLREYAVSSAD